MVSESAQQMRFDPLSSSFFPLPFGRRCAFFVGGPVGCMLKRTCGIAVISSNDGRDGTDSAIVAAGIHGRSVGAGRVGIRQAGAGRAPVCCADTADSTGGYFRAADAARHRHVMCGESFPHLLKHVFRLGHEVINVSKKEFIVGLAAVVIGGAVNRRVVVVRVIVVAVQLGLERLPGRRIRTEAGRIHARAWWGAASIGSILHLHGRGRWLGRFLHCKAVDGSFLSKMCEDVGWSATFPSASTPRRSACGCLRGDFNCLRLTRTFCGCRDVAELERACVRACGVRKVGRWGCL